MYSSKTMKKEMRHHPTLSIVTTLYQSAPYINEFYKRVTETAKKITDDYNIIMVNDGASDDSLEIALSLKDKDLKVMVIDLSRNFGHHRAIMTGLSFAKGDYVFFVDCDLEEEPELLELFWNELQKSKNVDIVFGVQLKRKGGLFEKLSGALFNKMISTLSDVHIPENVALIRLMTRRYVDNLLRYNEKELTFVGITALTGFNQKVIPITKKHKGTTTYTLARKINLALNYITSLSNAPLIYIFYIGIFITSTSLFVLLWVVYRKLFLQTALGWTSVVVSIWLVGGIIIFFLGIIAIYLSKIFIEVKNRPLTIVKEVHFSTNE